MRKTAKVTRELQCAYLYADGSLAEMYQESRGGVQIGETVDVTRGYARVDFHDVRKGANENGYNPAPLVDHGRLVIHSDNLGLLPLLKGAWVRCYAPDVDGGSPRTREKGIAVGGLYATVKGGARINLNLLEEISSGLTVQVDRQYKTAARDDAYIGQLWGHDARINAITDTGRLEAQSDV